MNKEIYVYADWPPLQQPTLVGVLRSAMAKNREHFSFTYDNDWLQSTHAQKIDPELELFSGEQHNSDSQNFRIFLDSCPDRWGQTSDETSRGGCRPPRRQAPESIE